MPGGEQISNGFRTECLMPEYECHKVVRAAKVTKVYAEGLISDGLVIFVPGPTAHTLFVNVGSDWIKKFEPEVGGYLVMYDGGYLSFSPSAAFENGYTLVSEAKKS